MFKAKKNWNELESFLRECRNKRIASSFELLTTSDEIIVIAKDRNKNTIKKRIKTISIL